MALIGDAIHPMTPDLALDSHEVQPGEAAVGRSDAVLRVAGFGVLLVQGPAGHGCPEFRDGTVACGHGRCKNLT